MRIRIALLALAALLPVAAASAQTSAQPNVLWLCAEDMSPWLACYGDSTVPTPNLDRLAQQSVRYDNAFASSPVCAPARSSLITGMYASRMGTMHMRATSQPAHAAATDPNPYQDIPVYEGVPPDFVRCFPELLRAEGYYCSNNGKTDYQFAAPSTVWDADGSGAHWRNRAPGQPFFAVFNSGLTHERGAFPGFPAQPSVVSPQAVTVPPLYPDTPAVRDALARTYDNIAALDFWVGERLEELDQSGVADSTVVFFFSDHGVGLPRGKRSPYDLGLRIPLLVRKPGFMGGGSTESRVVSQVDFAPTVLSLAGVVPDTRLDGVPFLGPHAQPGSGLSFSHADRFDEVYDRARTVSDGRYRYVRNLVTDRPHLLDHQYRNRLPMMADLQALRVSGTATPEQWQVVSTTRPTEELYDTWSDPWEVQNLASSPAQAQRLATMRQQLDQWMSATGDLGQVLPEATMVSTHLWPGGAQPQTQPVTVQVSGGLVHLSCATPGASIGYRRWPDGEWIVYDGPFPVPAWSAVLVLTHRLGYQRTVSGFQVP